MANIKIPTPLRAYTDGQAQLTLDGDTVGAVLKNLIAQFPDLEQHLFNDGELRNFVNIFLGEDDVRFLDGLDTPIDADDNLRIIPSIAGGCCC
jgi:molybdopterin converting factor small subunit